MLIRDRIKILLIPAFLLLPLCAAFYAGFESRMERADFVFVNQGELSSLDPALATGIPEGRILMAICEGLTSLHPKTLEPVPACAESWELSEDGRTYTFRLREGLAWSDGRSLDAGDFVFSWHRLLDPATASSYAYLLWNVEGGKEFNSGRSSLREIPGLEARDPLTFVVHLDDPCSYFPVLAAYYPLFPVDADCIRRHGEEEWLLPEHITTNGPFRVKARYLKDRIRLERNAHYWDAANVGVETIDALAVTSPITALNLYLTGEVDWINHVPSIVLPFVKERKDFTLTPNLGTNFLRFNVTRPPLDDARVRRAIHLAIDKDALVEYVLKGGQEAATSFVPPGIPGYEPPKIAVHDTARARSLLGEAGFPGGAGFPDLNLLYIASESSRDVAEVIALELKKNLNIRIHPTAQERKGYFVSQNSLSYHLCLCSWLGDYLDPSTFLDVFLSSSGNNRTGWRSGEYDALLSRAAGEQDKTARIAMLVRAEALLLEERPLAPLYFRTTANMIKPEWEGYYDNIQDVHPLKYIRRRHP